MTALALSVRLNHGEFVRGSSMTRPEDTDAGDMCAPASTGLVGGGGGTDRKGKEVEKRKREKEWKRLLRRKELRKKNDELQNQIFKL